MRRRGLALAVVVVVIGGGAAATGLLGRAEPPVSYRLAPVEQGPLASVITASGSLNAVVTVEVSSQLSGQIAELNADYNSVVTRGQVLARLDGAQVEARLDAARADLDAARATLAVQVSTLDKAAADVDSARAAVSSASAQAARAELALAETERDLSRRRDLRGRGVVATADLEKTETAMRTAQTQIASAKAAARQADAALAAALASQQVSLAQRAVAQAQVAQKEAALKLVQVDINRSVIRSPIDGVVVARSVSTGQTVAASLQAPNLFTIAQDLRQMQVLANIDEADIGRVRVGQEVRFTVNAFAGEIFHGTVAQVRLEPEEEQSVVTYIVVISVDNADLRLLPGMTANLRIAIAERQSVLKLPNAALRFRPPGVAAKGTEGAERLVWVAGADGAPVSVGVTPGISDGSQTEIVAGGLVVGQEVIIGIQPPVAGKRGPRLGF